jgi:hypothetical protein
MKNAEIAAEIASAFKRWEADPLINSRPNSPNATLPYYHAAAWASGARIFVSYISYQSQWSMTKAEALNYLERIRNGFVGRHFQKDAT